MNLIEFINILKLKNKYYPITNEFVKKYHQDKGGYIKKAKKDGIKIDFNNGEPNQKWHFESYIESKIIENEKKFLKRTPCDVYNKLLCPELKLWIAEAVGIDKELVEKTAIEVKKFIDKNGKKSRSNASRQIINTNITWDMIEDKIRNTYK